ncbi:MAG TPA: serine/threonine-protein kinase [Pirellulaceae bacterium]|nr:serine/threonine-protein kinase [Pirellulaceae bacterium]
MSDARLSDDRVTPIVPGEKSLGSQVEELCERFEGRLRLGGSPRIEDYLDFVPEAHREGLVGELLAIELHWRRRHADDAWLQDYRRRLPDFPAVIENELRGVLKGSLAAEDLPTVAFIETASSRRLSDDRLSRSPFRRLGDYEVYEEIGRGGMAVVYRARQAKADRIVALKVIQNDRFGGLPEAMKLEIADRFRYEAQAEARLEHEHIVSVYDVGEVDGHPFFTMQYVEGKSVAELLQDGPMDSRRAAAYLEPVARAVHAAHQVGILHRDLKPHNILVDSKTDHALVADFGLAKVAWIDGEMTQAGQVLGTPSYMSPEQAQDSAHVTQATDVYSLGATLYHMLTSRAPFQAANLASTLKHVIEQEPVPPRELNPSVDRDLEIICLKCLDKQPSRRYASAETFADDLRRYLNNEPIHARPIRRWERIWRWSQRNPVTAGAISLALACLVMALAAATIGYVKTSASLAVARQAQEESDESFLEMRRAVDRFFTQASEHELLDQPGMQPLRQALLEEAVQYYQKFLSQRGNDPAFRDELGLAHFRVGRIKELIATPDEALLVYERARAFQERLVAEDASKQERLAALGDTMNRIGRVQYGRQDFEEASRAYEEALTIRQQLVASEPENGDYQRRSANTHMNIGLLERDRGNFPEARRELETAHAIRSRLTASGHRDVELGRDIAMGHFNLATVAIFLDDAVTAEEHLRSAAAMFEQLLDDSPGTLQIKHQLATCYRVLADVKCEEGGQGQAITLYQNAREQMEALVLASPDVVGYKASLSGILMNLGLLQGERQLVEEALRSLNEARRILEQLVRDYPDVPRHRLDLAISLREIGILHYDAKHPEAGENELKTARRFLEDLVMTFPDQPDYQAALDETVDLLNQLKSEL